MSKKEIAGIFYLLGLIIFSLTLGIAIHIWWCWMSLVGFWCFLLAFSFSENL